MNFNAICYGEAYRCRPRGDRINSLSRAVFSLREIKRPDGDKRNVNKVADDPIKIFPSTSAPRCNRET